MNAPAEEKTAPEVPSFLDHSVTSAPLIGQELPPGSRILRASRVSLLAEEQAKALGSQSKCRRFILIVSGLVGVLFNGALDRELLRGFQLGGAFQRFFFCS